MTKPRRSTKKAKKAARKPAPVADRRGEILEAAFLGIAERGLEGLRTRDVARRAGVNISTLHYHIGSKDDLVAAVVEHARDRFIRSQMESLPPDGNFTLKQHFLSAWRSFREEPALGIVLQELVVRAQRDAKVRDALREIHDGWNFIVEELLRASISRGEIRSSLDVRLGARIVTSTIIGALTELGVNPNAFAFEAFVAELLRELARPL